MPLFVRFWGVRGSIPTPGARTRRFGGNTSCVQLRHRDTLIVCDAGTGLRELGVHLGRVPIKGPLHVHLFVSHPHWDHIQGFPFFGPAYRPDVTIHVHCPQGDDRNYRLLSGQMSDAYFPVRFSDLGAKVLKASFPPEGLTLDGVRIRPLPMLHPGGSLGFRFDVEGASVLYATDVELDAMATAPKGKAAWGIPQELLAAARDVDLLIGDSQYFDNEYATKVGWGHPRASTMVDWAAQAGARKLALYHHDPMHSDRDIDVKVAACLARAQQLESSVEIFGAREGVELKLGA